MDSRDIFGEGELRLEDDKSDYGLLLVTRLGKSPPTKKRFGRMSAYCSPCMEADFLFHGNYRLMKKADFSFVDCTIDNIGLQYSFKEHLIDFQNSRLFCNGTQGIIIPTKYL